jgi:hypothetical protein
LRAPEAAFAPPPLHKKIRHMSQPPSDPRIGLVAAAHETATSIVDIIDRLEKLLTEQSLRRDRRLVEGAAIAALNMMAATQQLTRLVAVY